MLSKADMLMANCLSTSSTMTYNWECFFLFGWISWCYKINITPKSFINKFYVRSMGCCGWFRSDSCLISVLIVPWLGPVTTTYLVVCCVLLCEVRAEVVRAFCERDPAGRLLGLTVTVVSPVPPALTTAVFTTPPIVSVVALWEESTNIFTTYNYILYHLPIYHNMTSL